jgi:hypothetical protein
MVIRRAALALTALALLAVCGCGADDTAVEKTASAFGAALGAGDLSGACELLAPATRATMEYQQSRPCPQAISQRNLAGGAVVQIEVWGGQAQARAGSDTWFLTRTAEGWRVAAAGCVAQADDAAYACKVSGP